MDKSDISVNNEDFFKYTSLLIRFTDTLNNISYADINSTDNLYYAIIKFAYKVFPPDRGGLIVRYLHENISPTERTQTLRIYLEIVQQFQDNIDTWVKSFVELVQYISFGTDFGVDNCWMTAINLKYSLPTGCNYKMDVNLLIKIAKDNLVKCLPSKKEKLPKKGSLRWFNRWNLWKTYPFFALELLMQYKEPISKKLLSNLLEHIVHNQYKIPDSFFYGILFNLRQSKFEYQKKSIYQTLNSHVIINDIAIGILWENLCFQIISSIYEDKEVFYHKILPNGKIIDIGVREKGNDTFNIIYECKKTEYYASGCIGDEIASLTNNKTINKYSSYTKCLKFLILEGNKKIISNEKVEILYAKNLLRKKLLPEHKNKIRELLKHAENVHKKGYSINLNVKPASEMDYIYDLLETIYKSQRFKAISMKLPQ